MANVLTIRVPNSLLARVDRKAASLGRTRAEHVREVLTADAATAPRHLARFTSLALKGRYALGRGSQNAAVRRALARRAYEKDR